MTTTTRTYLLTDSHTDEQCRACAGVIPAWQTHVISWVGQADDVRLEHQDCAAEQPATKAPGLSEFGQGYFIGALGVARTMQA